MLASDGRVTIVGRVKDLIISGGYNIYPKEIEEVLNNCRGILERAVFGIPHPDYGESVVAAVVAESGYVIDEMALDKIISRQLARFKHPRAYVILEALPRNAMGKVQKNVLRENFVKRIS